jgi:HTH-type transcriptional regulator / antitoxin HipB
VRQLPIILQISINIIMAKSVRKSNLITTFDEHVDRRYGAKGTLTRQSFEVQSRAFRVGEMIKAERLAANLTQEELALKSGTQATQISKIENENAEISFSNLLKIIELGLGKQLNFKIV